MATEAVFPVLIAADGSSTARAAVMTTLMFPWPDKTEVHGVVARRTWATAGRSASVLEAFDRAFKTRPVSISFFNEPSCAARSVGR